jgi:O-antigen/teichoic acid export membrane protein
VWERLRRVVDWLRSPTGELSDRVLHGGVWSTLLNVTDRVLRLLHLVVLARLLSPSAFGLLGIALLTKTILSVLSTPGIEPAFVQQTDADAERYLDTIWVFYVVRGTAVAAAAFVFAPLVASFFHAPSATPVVRVVGATELLRGFVNPTVLSFRRDFKFHKQFAYTASGTVAEFLVAVVCAVVWGSVWALVAGIVASRTVRLVVSYVLSGYRPAVSFDREAAHELLSFGKWIWGTTLVVALATMGDDAVVGWALATAALGFYQVGFRLSNAPATEVTHVISSVTVPAYAKIRADPEALRTAFGRTLRVTSAIVVPMAAGIILVAPAFVPVTMGPAWTPMVPAMQTLALAGLVRAVIGLGGALFKGAGVPRWDFEVNAVRAAVIAVTIWPLTAGWGIAGAAASVALGALAALPLWLVRTTAASGLSIGAHARSFLGPVIGVAAMTVPVVAVRRPTAVGVVAAVAVGAIVYTTTTVTAYRFQSADALSDLRSLVE